MMIYLTKNLNLSDWGFWLKLGNGYFLYTKYALLSKHCIR